MVYHGLSAKLWKYYINQTIFDIPKKHVDPVVAPSPSVVSPPMKLAVPEATLWFAWLEWTSSRSILKFRWDLSKAIQKLPAKWIVEAAEVGRIREAKKSEQKK